MNAVRMLMVIWSMLSAAAPAMLYGRTERTVVDKNWTATWIGTEAPSERTFGVAKALRRQAWLGSQRLPRMPLANSWPNASWENATGSQALTDLELASRVSFKAEGMGFEPTLDFAATGECHCGCDNCQSVHAALALRRGSSNCPSLASLGVDLQRVIAAWGGLSKAIRKAVLALVESQE
jgi:hypothetical protein